MSSFTNLPLHFSGFVARKREVFAYPISPHMRPPYAPENKMVFCALLSKSSAWFCSWLAEEASILTHLSKVTPS